MKVYHTLIFIRILTIYLYKMYVVHERYLFEKVWMKQFSTSCRLIGRKTRLVWNKSHSGLVWIILYCSVFVVFILKEARSVAVDYLSNKHELGWHDTTVVDRGLLHVLSFNIHFYEMRLVVLLLPLYRNCLTQLNRYKYVNRYKAPCVWMYIRTIKHNQGHCI